MKPSDTLSDHQGLLSLGNWSVGGVERSVLDIAQSSGSRILLPWVPRSQISETAKEWFPDNASWRVVDSRHQLQKRGFRRVWSLSQTLRDLPERVVNFHYSTVSGTSISDVLAAKLARKKVVITLHSPLENHPIPLRTRQRIKRAAHLSDAVVVTTPFAHDFVREITGRRPRIEVIHLGLEARPQADGWKHRQLLSIPKGDFVISHVARTHRGKGLPLVAKAIVLAGLERQVWLLTGGDGPDHQEVTTEVRRILGDRFIDQGWLADPDPTYAASDVMAMPSEVEAFGMVYLEAAAQGVPSIGYRTGGVPVAVDDGKTGFLANLGDEAEIVHHICTLYEDRQRCQEMGLAAKKRALGNFTVEKTGERYQRLFEELLNE